MQIDELVVALSLDASQFTDEQKKALEAFNKSQDAIDRRLKGLEERNKKSAQSFGDATHAAEGLFSALAGAGLVAFARDIVNTSAGVGRMATNVGVATGELSAFGRMMERNGGSAEAAQGTLKGLADSMQNLKWGRASADFLLGFSQIGGAVTDTPTKMVEKLARFADTHNAQEVQQTAARLGLSMEIANAAIKGSVRYLKEYRDAAAGALTDEQAKKLAEAQKGWVSLGQAVRMVGTDVVSYVADSLAPAAESVAKFTEQNRTLSTVLGGLLAAITALGLAKPAAWVLRLLGLGGAATAVAAAGSLPGMIAKGGGIGGVALAAAVGMNEDAKHGNPVRTWLREKLGIEDPGEDAPWVARKKEREYNQRAADSPSSLNPQPGDERMNPPPRPGAPTPAPPGRAASPDAPLPSGASRPAPPRASRPEPVVNRSPIEDLKATIRAEAEAPGKKRIDPDVAVRVAEAEGLKGFVGDKGSSFGAFQLHYGGIAPGGNAVSGLGEEFTKKTGLDARDPANEKATIAFAMDWVREHGWGDFHGAANTGVGKWQGVQRGGDVNIGTLTVQTESKDPREHGRLVVSEIERVWSGADQSARALALQANSGQRQ